MTECTIGVDIGSTSVKAALYDFVSDRILQVSSAPLSKPIQNLPLGFYEEDPIAIRNIAIEILRAISQKALELAPNKPSKDAVENAIKSLQAGKDIN